MDSSTFDRKYSYNFRHLYGKEGKRCDWSPYGCGKIITSFKSPGEGEHHGCPYQTFDSERLRGALEETMRERPNKSSFEDWSAVQKSINEIVSLAKDGHYQVIMIFIYSSLGISCNSNKCFFFFFFFLCFFLCFFFCFFFFFFFFFEFLCD